MHMRLHIPLPCQSHKEKKKAHCYKRTLDGRNTRECSLHYGTNIWLENCCGSNAQSPQATLLRGVTTPTKYTVERVFCQCTKIKPRLSKPREMRKYAPRNIQKMAELPQSSPTSCYCAHSNGESGEHTGTSVALKGLTKWCSIPPTS